MRYRTLALCIGLCLVLASSGTSAPDWTPTSIETMRVTPGMSIPGTMTSVAKFPDLTVTSAEVIGNPIEFAGPKFVMVPLEITVKNVGLVDVTDDFNVGGWARTYDGNLYGYEFFVPGEAQLRGGVLCTGLEVESEETYRGFMILWTSPTNALMQVGKAYEINAMVDYDLDPDFVGECDISESNETNNKLITYYGTDWLPCR